MIIDGAKISEEILGQLRIRPKIKKILAAVLADSTGSPQFSSSLSFLKQKEKIAKELGVDFRIYKLNTGLKNDGLRKEIGRIAKQSRVGGVIVQLPLPEGVNRRYVLNAIPMEKDVDVLSEKAQEAFRSGRSKILPPAVGVVDAILTTYNLQLTTQKVAIVGAGFLVGKPIAEWLNGRCKELTIFDEGSDLNELKNYDLIISGVGKAGIIKPEILKNGATVIDFGYSIGEAQGANGKSRIKGDFDAERFAIRDSRFAFYTPTPGGTGPILVAKLFENFYKLNVIRKK